MKKNGFVFVESIAVLVVIVLALTLFLSSYNVLVRKSKSKDYYDLPKDKYLLYSIANLGDNTQSFSVNTTFLATKDNCGTYLNSRMDNCAKVFDDYNLEYFLVVYDLKNTLESGAIKNVSGIKSDIIEYLKTLKKSDGTNGINYIIGVFKRDGKKYYASLVL